MRNLKKKKKGRSRHLAIVFSFVKYTSILFIVILPKTGPAGRSFFHFCATGSSEHFFGDATARQSPKYFTNFSCTNVPLTLPAALNMCAIRLLN